MNRLTIGVNRLADRLRGEVVLTSLGENVAGIERSVTSSIIYDVTPHLQHP